MTAVTNIGIGIIGGGYMGKAHAVAMAAVGAVFNTRLRPRLEMVAASSEASAERYRAAYGFARATGDWRVLVADPAVEAIVIASPPEGHHDIALAAFAAGKPVLCEKPLAATLPEAQAMADAAQRSGVVHMVGFNYVRTPATQYARQLLANGAIGDIVWMRGEHTEDFLADPNAAPTRHCFGAANGCMGDLAPHMVNAAMALCGPITRVMADVEQIHSRGGVVDNDDQGQMMCRFDSGAMGHLFFSRVATGRKMGYAYEIHGTGGAIRFDQEDQNALWLYRADGPEAERGFRKILTGPAHPDFEPFCQGPGHGTGYQDQIIIEARDFLDAIADGRPRWPDFNEGLRVARVIDAAHASSNSKTWQEVAQ